MRPFLEKYGLIVVVVLICAAGVYAYCAHQASGHVSVAMAYYIDEESGVESVQLAAENPPLLNKDGKPTLVRVVKFSCDGGKTVTTGYWEKYTDEAKVQMDDPDNPLHATVANTGLLVRSPEAGGKWVPQGSAEGEAVLRRVTCPDGKAVTYMAPPAK